MRKRGESGQALLLVVLALGIFLIGALGLAVDGAQMYGHRQMAQAAADAAAQAGMASIFNGTANSGTTAFPTSGSFICSTSDLRTPCRYASFNQFGGTAADVVTIDYPGSGATPGVSLSSVDPVAVIRVTVQRTLNTGLIRLLGPSTSLVKAIAIAAIVDVVSPAPILITHPTLSGSLSTNGGPTITICGGPRRSIEVNSSSSTSLNMSSTTTIDLSKAGPLDSMVNPCTTGTGSDFGTFGGPSSPPFTFVSGIGKYLQPASPILDPLASIPAPVAPAAAPLKTALGYGVSGCPASGTVPKPCQLYSPGRYTNGISVKNETGVFKPGLYYIDSGGFNNESNGVMLMATGFAPDANTGGGMVVYNAGPGIFSVGSNSSASLVGADLSSIYKGILFFQNRNGPANTGMGGAAEHRFGGGGEVILKGTIYLTNSLSVMKASPGQYQTLQLQGSPGSTTKIVGDIIVSALKMGGNAGITMQLNSVATYQVRQLALVK